MIRTLFWKAYYALTCYGSVNDPSTERRITRKKREMEYFKWPRCKEPTHDR